MLLRGWATNCYFLGGFGHDLPDGELARYPSTSQWNRDRGTFRRRGTPHEVGKIAWDTGASAWCDVWQGGVWEVMYGHFICSWVFAPHLISSNFSFMIFNSYHVTVFPIVLKVGFPTSMWFTQLRLVILAFVHGSLDNLLSLIGVPCSSYVGINAGTSGRDFLLPMGLPWVLSVVSSNLVTGRSLCCSCRPFLKTYVQTKYDYFTWFGILFPEVLIAYWTILLL